MLFKEYIYFFIIITLIFIIGYLLYLLKLHQNKDGDQNTIINGLKDKLLQLKNENLLVQQKAIFIEKQSEKIIEQFKSLSHETVASQSFSFIKILSTN
jgi:hypothetical protein